MSGDHQVRALVVTQSTLKWFGLIGIAIMVIGIIFQLFLQSFIGLLFLWGGITISALSLISLIYLWLSDRYLPQPK
ncbi:MAG: hypothetical protein ACFFDC_10140 [Promethearchaeota archaeon]